MCWPYREQAHSHRVLGCFRILRPPQIHCRSEPARESVISGDCDVGCAGLIASRLTPTGFWVASGFCVHRRSTVGASLLAKASFQATVMLDVLALSRAGSLPQGFGLLPDFASTADPL